LSQGDWLRSRNRYGVRRFHGVVGGEPFELPDQSAQEISRYDVIKDVVRMESFVADGVAERGRVIVLTNDPAYWQPGRSAETIGSRARGPSASPGGPRSVGR
jgi:hypothetical protein